MTTLAIAAPPQVTLPIEGSDARFPVRRIYCVGRNYAAHAVEMGHDPDREPPFFFLKPADCIRLPGEDFPYPVASSDVHFEIEQIMALGTGGSDIPLESALDHVWGYGVGLDMTRRDLQGAAKKAGRPWDTGKGFDASAPMSALRPASEIGHPAKGRVSLHVNGALRQDGDMDQMIWKPAEIVSYLSGLFALAPGDLIMTGTPAGVGPVERGDHLVGEIEGIGALDIRVV